MVAYGKCKCGLTRAEPGILFVFQCCRFCCRNMNIIGSTGELSQSLYNIVTVTQLKYEYFKIRMFLKLEYLLSRCCCIYNSDAL